MRPLKTIKRLALLITLTTICAISYSQSQVDWESQYFTTSDSVKLHYLEAGSGPTLVLVTGWSVPAWIWQHQLRYFAPKYRVIALDPRGQGKSEKPSFGYHANRRARDIWDLLHHLDTEPVVLAGWSSAVQEVMVGTYEFGIERIRAIILVDHPVNISEEISDTIARSWINNLQLNRAVWTREFIEAIHQTKQTEPYFDSLTNDILRMPTNAVAIMIVNDHLIGPNDLRTFINEFDKPALFIYSSLDWAKEAAQEVREIWPNVPVIVLHETSHAVFVDKPGEFNQIVEAFIANLSN